MFVFHSSPRSSQLFLLGVLRAVLILPLVFGVTTDARSEVLSPNPSDQTEFVLDDAQPRVVYDWVTAALAHDAARSGSCRLVGVSAEQQVAVITLTCRDEVPFSLRLSHPDASAPGVLVGNVRLDTGEIPEDQRGAAQGVMERLTRTPLHLTWTRSAKKFQPSDIMDSLPPNPPPRESCSLPVGVFLILFSVLLAFLVWRTRVALANRASHALNAVNIGTSRLARALIRMFRALWAVYTTLWRHSAALTLLVLLLVAVCLGWGIQSTDPDFTLAEFFGPFSLAIILLMIGIGLIPNRTLRLNLSFILVVIPALTVIGMEMYFKYRDVHSRGHLEITEDRLLRYTYRPGVGVNRLRIGPSHDLPVNFLGLNDREYDIPKPAGVFRIALLGDSVPNDGELPFEELFHERLETRLNQWLALRPVHGIRRVEVLNVSCEGYNTLQEVRLLEKAGLRYEPDLVIVAYVLNDPFLQNGAYRRVGNSFFLFQAMTGLAFLVDRYLDIPVDIYGSLHRGYSYDLIVRNSFERLTLLAALHRFDVLVAVLPIMMNFERHPFEETYRQVARTAEDQGFPSLVMFDEFRKHPLDRFRKFNDISHPNTEGHRLMADILTAYLLARPPLR